MIEITVWMAVIIYPLSIYELTIQMKMCLIRKGVSFMYEDYLPVVSDNPIYPAVWLSNLTPPHNEECQSDMDLVIWRNDIELIRLKVATERRLKWISVLTFSIGFNLRKIMYQLNVRWMDSIIKENGTAQMIASPQLGLVLGVSYHNDLQSIQCGNSYWLKNHFSHLF